MPARWVQVSVECCEPSTGMVQVSVDDPANAEPDLADQQLILDPATTSLLHALLGTYVTKGISVTQGISLNVPSGERQQVI